MIDLKTLNYVHMQDIYLKNNNLYYENAPINLMNIV